MPRFSILSVTFNSDQSLVDSFFSLYNQKFQDFEHIVQDGLSEEATLKLITEFTDVRQNLLSEQDTGIYDALNRAFSRSRGDIIGVLHSDDFYAKNTVLDRVNQTFIETNADIVFCDIQYVHKRLTNRVLRTWHSGKFSRSQLKFGWMPPHTGFFIKRDVMERAGGYDNKFRISGDYEAMLRWLLLDDIKAVHLPEMLVKMRSGGLSNGSLHNKCLKYLEDYIALKRHGMNPYLGIFFKNVRKLGQYFKMMG
ncbi:glycosyltransferase [Planktomarina temperata]|nr:glycosyltransferase [Planktomarina temperata]